MTSAHDLPAPLVQDLINLAKQGGTGRVGFNRPTLVRHRWIETVDARTVRLTNKALAIPAVAEALT